MDKENDNSCIEVVFCLVLNKIDSNIVGVVHLLQIIARGKKQGNKAPKNEEKKNMNEAENSLTDAIGEEDSRRSPEEDVEVDDEVFDDVESK